MKNLLTIVAVCFSIATATAQDTKPTKEETFQYIKNEIGEREYCYFVGISNSMSEMKLNGCELTFKEKSEYKGEITYTTIVIPMDQIEKVELDTNMNRHDVIFIAHQQNKLINDNDTMREKFALGFYYYFGKNDESNEPSSRNTEKLVKAFNHLRKLCNAPEPISFD